MHQKSFFVQRFRGVANSHQFRLFWGLRFALAFLLLLLALSQAGSSPMTVKAVALLSLALFGLICFLDMKRETNSVDTSVKPAFATQPRKTNLDLSAVKNEGVVASKNFRAFRIQSVVFEVNTLVEQHKLLRKTVELFVLPDTSGSRYAPRVIARLKAAGYAIRPHSAPPPLQEITETDTSLIGVHDGCVYVLLGNR